MSICCLKVDRFLIIFVFILSLFLSAFTSCGYNPDDPPYDTKANPDHFPKAALTLLDKVQAGEISGLEMISEGFGNLYSSNTSLLDNEKWKNVIVRLGAQFAQLADINKDRGIGFYLKASEYYLLASFARPEDEQLRYQAALFGGWLAAYSDPEINFDSLVMFAQEDLSIALEVGKQFLLGNDQQREFFDLYLADQLKQKLSKVGELDDSNLVVLNNVDYAIAHAAGFARNGWEREKIATFISFLDVKVDLLAAMIKKIDTNRYQIELYFLPHGQLATDITVALNLKGEEDEFPDFSQELHYLPVRVEPKLCTSGWGGERVIGIVREFEGYSKLSSIFIGITAASGGDSDKYFGLSGADQKNTHIPLKLDMSNL